MNGFSLWIGLGAALGLWRVSQSAPKRQAEAWIEMGLWVLLIALIGARLSYVLLHWAYFSAHPLEMIAIWQGGLTWPGAFGGAALAVVYLTLRAGTSLHLAKETSQLGQSRLGTIADRLYPLLPSIAITAWVGCWQTGVGYGAALPANAWWGVPLLDERGFYSLRFPVQPLAALSLLLFFGVLEAQMRNRRPAGRFAGLAVAGLLLHTLLFSLLRADPSPRWYGLRADTWAAIFYLLIGLVYFTAKLLRGRLMKHPAVFSIKQFLLILIP